MTWTSLASASFGTSTTFSWTPGQVGDILLLAPYQLSDNTTTVTGVSSSNGTWSNVAGNFTGTHQTGTTSLWMGVATSTSSQTVTVSWSAATPATLRFCTKPFRTSLGGTPTVVGTAHVDSAGTNTDGAITCASGNLYWAFDIDSGTASAGATSGFTYEVDGTHGNGECYNLSTGSGSIAPVWGDSGHVLGRSIALQENIVSVTGVAAHVVVGAGTGSASGGTVAFPLGPLDLKTEMFLGGSWTDVTSYVYQRDGMSPPVSITRGKPDETTSVNPATVSFELNNRDGRFNPLNPTGPYYGQLGRNTLVAFSVPAAATHMRNDSGGGFSCPSSTGLNTNGDLDIQVDCDIDHWRGIVAGKWVGNAGWQLWCTDYGLQLWWGDGTNGHTANCIVPPPGRPGRVTLRAALTLSTGVVTFYYGPAGNTGSGSGWTTLQTVSTGVTSTSLGSNTGALAFGTNGGPTGDYYQGRLSLGGTVKASPDWTSAASGATSVTDAQGNVFSSFGGSTVTNRDYRFRGDLAALPTAWDPSGSDIAVPATAAGVTRRLGQGQTPVQSAFKRAMVAQTGTLAPVAYWPCEDGAGATSFGSAIGGSPMVFTTSTPPTLATDSTFLCSSALPTLGNSSWRGPVPKYTSNGSIVVRFLVHFGTQGYSGISGAQTLVRVNTSGTLLNFDLAVDSNYHVYIQGGNASGPTALINSQNNVFFNISAGASVWFSLELQPSGGNINWAAVALAPGAQSGPNPSGTISGTVGNAKAVNVYSGASALTDTAVGHVTVQSGWQSMFNLYQPLNAWQGEQAADRITRLCGENGLVPCVSAGTSAPMGAQGIATLMTLLQECETTDRGILYDSRRATDAIGYRTYASLCNQTPVTLDYSQATVGKDGSTGLQPQLDDQYVRNDVTATRGSSGGSAMTSGSTVQYQLTDGSAMSTGSPPGGVGDYNDSVTVNTETDSQVGDVAGWMVHVGTVNEFRWPDLPLNLARSELSSLRAALQALDVGDMLKVTNLPTFLTYDHVKQLLYGFREQLGGFWWLIDPNAVPESPYEVALLDNTTYGRADTDGSTLHTSVNATATSLSVDTASGMPLWTTTAGDFPFDIAVAGERMTVTNITGSSSPQTFTVTRSVNGVSKSQASGTAIQLWYGPYAAIL